jgi:hypothetical protein
MKKWFWGFVCAVGLAALPAGASTFLAVPVDELVSQADAVVEGRVIEAHSFWNAEKTAILTEAVLEVEDSIVGAAPAYVNLRTFGGRVGDYWIVAHGFPTFAVGERLVLFLEPEQDGAQRVLGYQQGQYRVREEKGVVMAVPALDTEARYVHKNGAPAPERKALPLADLKRELRAAAGRAGRPAIQ